MRKESVEYPDTDVNMFDNNDGNLMNFGCRKALGIYIRNAHFRYLVVHEIFSIWEKVIINHYVGGYDKEVKNILDILENCILLRIEQEIVREATVNSKTLDTVAVADVVNFFCYFDKFLTGKIIQGIHGIVIGGCPGSGKSYLSRILAFTAPWERRNSKFFCDELRKRLDRIQHAEHNINNVIGSPDIQIQSKTQYTDEDFIHNGIWKTQEYKGNYESLKPEIAGFVLLNIEMYLHRNEILMDMGDLITSELLVAPDKHRKYETIEQEKTRVLNISEFLKVPMIEDNNRAILENSFEGILRTITSVARKRRKLSYKYFTGCFPQCNDSYSLKISTTCEIGYIKKSFIDFCNLLEMKDPPLLELLGGGLFFCILESPLRCPLSAYAICDTMVKTLLGQYIAKWRRENLGIVILILETINDNVIDYNETENVIQHHSRKFPENADYHSATNFFNRLDILTGPYLIEYKILLPSILSPCQIYSIIVIIARHMNLLRTEYSLLRKVSQFLTGYTCADLKSLYKDALSRSIFREINNISKDLDGKQMLKVCASSEVGKKDNWVFIMKYFLSILKNHFPIVTVNYDDFVAAAKAIMPCPVKSIQNVATCIFPVSNLTSGNQLLNLKNQFVPLKQRSDGSFYIIKGFECIVGEAYLKAIIKHKIIRPFRERCASIRRICPLGFLLEGPSGSGKSLFAEAIAYECNAKFIIMHSGEFVEPYVGGTEKKIRNLFESVKGAGPIVIVLENIECIMPNYYYERTTLYGQLLPPAYNIDHASTLRISQTFLNVIDDLYRMRQFDDNCNTLLKSILVICTTENRCLVNPKLLTWYRLKNVYTMGKGLKSREDLIDFGINFLHLYLSYRTTPDVLTEEKLRYIASTMVDVYNSKCQMEIRQVNGNHLEYNQDECRQNPRVVDKLLNTNKQEVYKYGCGKYECEFSNEYDILNKITIKTTECLVKKYENKAENIHYNGVCSEDDDGDIEYLLHEEYDNKMTVNENDQNFPKFDVSSNKDYIDNNFMKKPILTPFYISLCKEASINAIRRLVRQESSMFYDKLNFPPSTTICITFSDILEAMKCIF